MEVRRNLILEITSLPKVLIDLILTYVVETQAYTGLGGVGALPSPLLEDEVTLEHLGKCPLDLTGKECAYSYGEGKLHESLDDYHDVRIKYLPGSGDQEGEPSVDLVREEFSHLEKIKELFYGVSVDPGPNKPTLEYWKLFFRSPAGFFVLYEMYHVYYCGDYAHEVDISFSRSYERIRKVLERHIRIFNQENIAWWEEVRGIPYETRNDREPYQKNNMSQLVLFPEFGEFQEGLIGDLEKDSQELK